MTETNRKTSQKKAAPPGPSRASAAPPSSTIKSSHEKAAAAQSSTSTKKHSTDTSNMNKSANGVNSRSGENTSSSGKDGNSSSSSRTRTRMLTGRSSEKLYALLGVSKNATSAEIGKAYRALALLLHPDKVLHRLQQKRDEEEKRAGGNDISRKKQLKLGKADFEPKNGKTNSVEKMRQEATRHFQELQHAYSILKDPARRRLYDETGLTGEDGEEPQSFEEAYAFYRNLYPEIDECAIEKFRERYLASDAEKDDIREFCAKFNGDLTRFFEYIPFSEKTHIPRYVKLLHEIIEKKELPQSKLPTKKAIVLLEQQAVKMEKLTAREAAQLQKHKNASSSEKPSKKRKEADLDGLQALALAIQNNASKRARSGSCFLDQLAQKYGERENKGGCRRKCNK